MSFRQTAGSGTLLQLVKSGLDGATATILLHGFIEDVTRLDAGLTILCALQLVSFRSPKEWRTLRKQRKNRRTELRGAEEAPHRAMLHLSDWLDQRGDEEYELAT